MMKKVFSNLSMFILFSILILALVACGHSEPTQKEEASEGESKEAASQGETIKIKIADSFPNSHTISKYATLPWIDRIEELGEGKIEVEYYPAEQLGKADSLLDVAKNKVADITYVGPLYVSDTMPLSGVVGNPGLVKDAISGTKAYNKLVHEDLYEVELKPHGVKPLWAAALNPYQIVNSKHPVKEIKDFKGLKIRTSGGLQEQLMQNWGVTPVSVPAPEIYTAWDRGTLDGTLISLFSWPGYQIEKLAKYSTVNAKLSSFGVMYVVNEEVWESWPEEVRQAVEKASNEASDMMAQAIVDHENALMEEYKEQGVEFYELPEEELQKWDEELEPFNRKWAENLDAKGMPGTEILEKFTQYNEEFSK
ncbi:hypothetical protein DCC39_08435 [Pueribacillus theae]|uniref:C4-dicarboxylate ABC transporter substrate-binding protein n=1 Tax=Pueribacillus theae TaxID=2171751 RepID=A0A2U1K3G4_9BACI|nr:TRAP transporter substrate-binding protein DctP [Pueribacillus theae]PWA11952.1 hypothetical protein DCC39_08435 [Pueribacillus theae]